MILRGRTLADFVDKTKGEKWKAFSELLGLEAIDRVRLDLQRARNDLDDQAQRASTELSEKRAVLSEMGTGASEEGVYSAIVAKCEAAGVRSPDTLDQALTSEWRKTAVPDGSTEERVVALRGLLAESREAAKKAIALDRVEDWNEFVSRERGDQLRLGVYRAADSLLRSSHARDGECPLCKQPLGLIVLRESVATELRELEGAAEALEAERRTARGLVEALREAAQRRARIVSRALAQGVRLAPPPTVSHDHLARSIDELSEIDRSVIEPCLSESATWDREVLVALEAAIPAPHGGHDQALIALGALLVAATAWRDAVRRDTASSAALKLADRVFGHYQAKQHEQFRQVIARIAGRVAEIYHFLHPEEGIGAVTIETVGAKGAELAVEFHSKKEMPPHRVLSESHLNSLGIALFLAMAETSNDQIGFLVLDDVVNSFDREHRGRLAELLVDQFSETQLIVLTHDEQFFTRISLRAPSWVHERFTSWSYNDGPRTQRYTGDRMLMEANEALEGGDRAGAAQKGRRALEELLQEACERLEALLPFRRGQHNDLRPAVEVLGGLRRTLKDRARSLYAQLNPLLQHLEADLQASLNVESHASPGSTSSQEVRDALVRIAELRESFTCAECGTRAWYAGSPDASRCKCGQHQFPPVDS